MNFLKNDHHFFEGFELIRTLKRISPLMKTKNTSKIFGKKNEFQNKYRQEINDIISGIEYLDTLMQNGGKPKSPQKDPAYDLKCEMTEEDKRKLMFQKPITLIKRQTNYCRTKKPMKSPIKSKKNIKKDENRSLNNSADLSPQIEKVQQPKRETKTSHNFDATKSPKSQASHETPKTISKHCTEHQFNNPIIQDNPLKENHPEKSSRLSAHPQIKNDHIQVNSEIHNNQTEPELSDSSKDIIKTQIADQSNDSYNQSSDYQSYMSFYFDRSFNNYKISEENEDQDEEESSESFDYQEMQTQITIENATRSISSNRFSMISSSIVETQVDFSSDCSESEDDEFHNDFFIQENVSPTPKPQIPNNYGCFISSGAIESFSDS